MGIEGGHAIEDSVRLLHDFHPLGKDIGKEMNRLGKMVDISHISGKTFWDALEVSSKPLIASPLNR